MEEKKDSFIYFKDVVKVLNDKSFYGFTVKRDNGSNRAIYSYHSVKYPNIVFEVLSMKLNPNEIPSNKIVLGIKENGDELKGWNDFIKALETNNLYKLNKYGKSTKET